VIVISQPDLPAFAEVARDTHNKATIAVGPSFWSASAKKKREIIGHEICHLLTWELAGLVPDSHATAREDAEELLVNTLEVIAARLLPPWPAKGPTS